jgi:hypothetical protein
VINELNIMTLAPDWQEIVSRRVRSMMWQMLDKRVEIGVVGTRFAAKCVLDRDGVGGDQIDQAPLLEDQFE